jgi:hypothetical protein
MYQDFSYSAVGKPVEEIFAGSGTKGDYAWTALNLVPGGGAAAKTGVQAAAKAPSLASGAEKAAATTPSILAAAGRAMKLVPSGVSELFRNGLWNMLGNIRSVRPMLSKVIGMRPFRDPMRDFKSAYNYVKLTKRTFFDGVVNKPKGPPPPRPGAPGGPPLPPGAPKLSESSSRFDDEWWENYVPRLTPFEALGDLSALLHNKFIMPITPPIKSGVSAIKSTFSKDNISSQMLKISPRSISDFLYRYTPVGSIQALRLAKQKGMKDTIADIGPGLDLPLPEFLQQAMYHGGALPEQLANRLTPFSDKVINGNIMNFDLFTTVEKLMAREYAIGKNAESGGSIWKMLLDAPKSMSKIWDMRGGSSSLWSQNKSGYAALEKYFIDVLKVPVQEARAMLAGERVPGVAKLSQALEDRMHLFHGEKLNEAFSSAKNGGEWIIDSVVHTGGKLTNSDILHGVFASLDPEKYVSSFSNILPKSELVKTFQTFDDFLPSQIERFIEQYKQYGRTFDTLLQGTWPVKHKIGKGATSAATGGYLNNGKIELPKFKNGGKVLGRGTATSDSIPAYLSNGEYVVKADSVKKYGVGTLNAINAGKFAEGGPVTPGSSQQLKFFPWSPDLPNYLNGKPTGDPRTGRWGELRYNPSNGKDIWGGTENPGLNFSGKIKDISDYWHQMQEQPNKLFGSGMGIDKDPMRYAGSGASMGGMGMGAYGLGPLMLAGGGLVGNILGGIGKLISKLFVGKQAGKAIKPNQVEKFLSDTLGDVPLPKIKKEELPAGVGGQYIPRFSDKSSNYENLLPHILFNSKYKVQGNTAIHETMHHFDMDVLHDSFRKTIAKLRKDGKKDLADEYESLFVTAENKQKGMGLATWEDRAITLEDYDSLTYFGGTAEAFADESTFKAYTKFMSSKKIKDKKLALKIGNPYGPGYGDLRGYFSSYAQFENNALNMPMRLNPSFLRGLVENSPNMPQATKDVYLGWAEGLQRFKPPARTNPDEIRNSLQWQNFKKYITDNGLDKAKGFHDGGPVGHKHPSTSYSPAPMSDAAKQAMLLRTKLIRSGAMSNSLPKIPYHEQFDPLTGKAFRFPTDDEYIFDSDQLIPPSMRSKKPWYEPFKRMANPAAWGIGTDLRGKEVTGGVVDLPYNVGKFAYDNLIFPTALWADRMTGLAPTFNDSESGLFNSSGYFASTNRNQEAEWMKKAKEEGLGSVLPAMAGQTALDFAAILPWNRIGGAVGNIGLSKATIAQIASKKAADKAAKKLALEQAGIGFRGTLNRLADNAFLSKTLPKVSSFAPRKKIIKQKVKSGEELTDEEQRLFDAIKQSKAGGFTPIESLSSASHATLLKELEALTPETGFTPDGQFIFKFTPARAADFPNPEDLAAGIKAMKDDPLSWSVSEFPGPPHRLEFFWPGRELTDAPIAKLQWNSVTGSIGGMNVYKPGLKGRGIAKFANAYAASKTRLQHSRNRTDEGIAYSKRVTGLMPGFNIADEIPLIRAFANRLGIKPIEPYIPPAPPVPKSTYEEVFDQQRGFTPDATGLLPSGLRMEPNPESFMNNSAEANARRAALEAGTRARMIDNMSTEELDAARKLWRANPNRTHDTYPWVNGTIYDYADEYDLTALMKLGVSKPAGVPWRSNDARPRTPSFEGMTSDEYDGIRGATGGLLDKGKLRIPKFANGGLIKGPGTGISDSIQAGFGYAGGGSIRVSNGEYVVKASSVRDYGVKTMDAINNGTATVSANSGGTVYNINMPVTSNNANPEIVANEVMRKLKLEVSKNNKTNKVNL